MNNLIEGKYGSGAIKQNPLLKGLQRILRPHADTLGGITPEFDWSVGFDSSVQTGKLNIKNQGSSFSCGGQASSRFIEIASFIQKNTPMLEQSAKSIYANIAYPGGGTTISAIEKFVNNAGSNSELEVPSVQVVNGATNANEYFLTDKSWETPTLKTSALAKSNWIPVTVTVDIDSVAKNLRDYGAVILEIGGKNNGTWDNAYPVPLPDFQWRHYVCVKSAGLVNGKKTLSFYNSWGNIGEGGVQYFTEDSFKIAVIDAFTFQARSELDIQKETLIQKILILLQLWKARYFS